MRIIGYGEDALTFWLLKNRIYGVLEKFRDKTDPSNCLIFYRPSFGRRSRNHSPIFGEFDAIVASKENIYLIESKWDNLTDSNSDELILRGEQILRHKIFSWYLTHWNERSNDNWDSFAKEHEENFQSEFPKKEIAANSLLATNLEFILNALLEHCVGFTSGQNIKNVLLFFHKSESMLPTKTSKEFDFISIDYSKDILGNFIKLE